MDFEIIAQSGLTQKEFAELVPVSRITVNTWVMGHKEPHRYILRRVETLIAALVTAVEEGEFPLSGAANRPYAIKQTIKNALTRMRQS